jgi:hypothetical protein
MRGTAVSARLRHCGAADESRRKSKADAGVLALRPGPAATVPAADVTVPLNNSDSTVGQLITHARRRPALLVARSTTSATRSRPRPWLVGSTAQGKAALPAAREVSLSASLHDVLGPVGDAYLTVIVPAAALCTARVLGANDLVRAGLLHTAPAGGRRTPLPRRAQRWLSLRV